MKKTLFLNTKSPSYVVYDPIVTDEGQSFELGDWLASGGNGAVYTCIDSISGEDMAVKFLLQNSSKSAQRCNREVSLLKGLNNEHIVKYRGNGTISGTNTNKGVTRSLNIPFILMDLAEHNLSEAMKSRAGGFPYEDYSSQFRGLTGALAALHERAVHRDIKPENILIRGEYFGHDQYEQWAFAMSSIFDKLEVAEQQWFESGEVVVVICRFITHSRQNGSFQDQPMAQVVTVKDGKITDFRPFYWNVPAYISAAR